MLLQIFLILVALISLGFYGLYYRPKNKMQQLARKAQAQGYKVKLLPLQFMGYYLKKYFKKDQGSLKDLKQDWSNYDIVIGNIFTQVSILVSNPQLIKDVCIQANKFHKMPFITQVYQNLNGGGIVFTEGQVWRRKRRIISSIFHFDFLNDIIPTIEEQISLQFKKIDQKIAQGVHQIDIKKILITIMSNVIAKSFFGTDMKDYSIQGKPYCQYYMEFLEDVGGFIQSWQHLFLRMNGYKLGLTKKSRQLRRKINLLKAIAAQITLKQIQKIKTNKQTNKNILTALYQNGMLNLEGEQNPEQYTLYQLVGEFFTFFGAGTDTTTNTVNLALHYLTQFPQYAEKILEQYEKTKKMNLKTSDELKQLKFCDAVFNETLRINGPVMIIFSRISVEQVKIGSLELPKSSPVVVSPLVAHHNEKLFKEPSKFMPERWLNNQKIQPFSFIPFSAGQRNCIGQYLARIQSKLILSRICQKYQFKALNPIKMKPHFVYATKDGTFEVKHRKYDKSQ